MPDEDQQLAMAFVAELEKALVAIRSGDAEGIGYAEVQPTSLFLLERSGRFRGLLKQRFVGLADDPKTQPFLDGLADSDCELAGVISGFVECVFDVVNSKTSPGRDS